MACGVIGRVVNITSPTKAFMVDGKVDMSPVKMPLLFDPYTHNITR